MTAGKRLFRYLAVNCWYSTNNFLSVLIAWAYNFSTFSIMIQSSVDNKLFMGTSRRIFIFLHARHIHVKYRTVLLHQVSASEREREKKERESSQPFPELVISKCWEGYNWCSKILFWQKQASVYRGVQVTNFHHSKGESSIPVTLINPAYWFIDGRGLTHQI